MWDLAKYLRNTFVAGWKLDRACNLTDWRLDVYLIAYVFP